LHQLIFVDFSLHIDDDGQFMLVTHVYYVVTLAQEFGPEQHLWDPDSAIDTERFQVAADLAGQ